MYLTRLLSSPDPAGQVVDDAVELLLGLAVVVGDGSDDRPQLGGRVLRVLPHPLLQLGLLGVKSCHWIFRESFRTLGNLYFLTEIGFFHTKEIQVLYYKHFTKFISSKQQFFSFFINILFFSSKNGYY